MNTMIGLVALLTTVATANIQTTPSWSDGYPSAREAVVSAHKPMAVFFGKGSAGWEKVLKDGSFDPSINQMLASKYVCLYVDVTTWDGYNLAKTFEVAGKGLVISDASGKKQAFNLTGELTKAELKQKLEVYAKAYANCPKAGATTSYYQPAASNCPNGNCPKAATTTSNYQPAAANCPNGNCPKAAATTTSYYQPAGDCPNGNCPKRR